MRWFVETSSIGKADSTEKACIEAAGWQQALQDVRARRGDDGSFASFSIELMDEGYRAIDPATRTRFVITRAPDDAPLTTNGAAKTAASPPAAGAAGAPRSEVPRPGSGEVARVKPRVSIPDDPVPARIDPPKAPSTRPAAPVAAPRASAAPTARASAAPAGGGPTRILVAHRVASERAIEPNDKSPLTYREMALVVAEGTTHEEVLGLVRSRFESIRRTMEGITGRYVVVAVFDHTFDGKPKRLPIATLSWKDWRGDEPEIHFVDEEAPASVVANMGLHGLRKTSAAPPRPEPSPSTVPRSPDSIKRAAASMAGEDEATIVRSDPPVVEPPPAAASPVQVAASGAPAPMAVDDVTVVRASDPPPQARPSGPGEVPATVRSAPPAATLAAATAPEIPPNPVPIVEVETEPPVEVEIVEEEEAPAPTASAPPQAPTASAPPQAATASAPPQAASFPPPSMTPAAVAPGERIKGDELLAELFEASGDLQLVADALDGADFVIDLALAKLPCEAGIISFFDINRREFVIVRQRGGTQKALLSSLPEKSEIAHRAMRSGHAVVSSSVAADDNRWRAMGVAPRSAVCAPVILGGRYLGLLELANPLDGEPLDAADGNALGYLGQQLAEFLATRTISLEPSLVTKPPLRSRMR